MAITGSGSAYEKEYESRYTASTKEVTGKQEAEGTTGKKYTNAQAYYDYLKSKYECLSARDYKVTVSPVLLEKCVKDPEQAELLEKNLAHIPVSYRYFSAAWNALGAKIVNQEFIFDENGNCGGSSNTYVTNNNVSSGSGIQDNKTEKKPTSQKYYEKRKHLQEQFEEKQAQKALIRQQFEERLEEKEADAKLREKDVLSRKQNAEKVMERYEASAVVLEKKYHLG